MVNRVSRVSVAAVLRAARGAVSASAAADPKRQSQAGATRPGSFHPPEMLLVPSVDVRKHSHSLAHEFANGGDFAVVFGNALFEVAAMGPDKLSVACYFF